MGIRRSRLERFLWWLSEKLPDSLLYFAAIRVWAYATSGRYEATEATSITADDAIHRFGADKIDGRWLDNGPRAYRIYAAENYGMTHDQYFEELDVWLKAQKESDEIERTGVTPPSEIDR